LLFFFGFFRAVGLKQEGNKSLKKASVPPAFWTFVLANNPRLCSKNHVARLSRPTFRGLGEEKKKKKSEKTFHFSLLSFFAPSLPSSRLL
jgi:hypothetical protein